MRRFVKALRDNSLSIVLFALFVASIGGAVWSGWLHQSETLAAHHRGGMALGSYLGSATFIDGLAVNWQAAILQLASLVVFSSFLYQRGSPHSRKPDRHSQGRRRRKPGYVPSWVRRNSLFIAFALLFVVSFCLHAVGGAAASNSERALMSEPPMTLGDYLVSSKFWWQNFQTWQAEYLVIALYLVLSVFLRQKGSAESKPEDAPDGQTGEHNE